MSLKIISIVGAALSALLATGAAAQEPPADFRPPAWRERPNFSAVFHNMPQRLMRDRDLTIRCRAQLDETLSDCEVTDDRGGLVDPALRRSLLEMLETARMIPAEQDGQPIVSAMQFPFTIRMTSDSGRPDPRLIQPVWVEAPTAGQINTARPAASGEVYGTVKLRCGLGADGRPQDCRVSSERPVDGGFGAAALSLAPLFRTESSLPPGISRDEAGVEIVIAFPTRETAGDASLLRGAPWLSTPSAEALAARYPAGARDLGLREGRATALCVVQSDGRLGECAVTEANPPGVGFENSAETIAGMFAVSPWQSSGGPTAGRTVRLPFVFIDPNPTASDGAGD